MHVGRRARLAAYRTRGVERAGNSHHRRGVVEAEHREVGSSAPEPAIPRGVVRRRPEQHGRRDVRCRNDEDEEEAQEVEAWREGPGASGPTRPPHAGFRRLQVHHPEQNAKLDAAGQTVARECGFEGEWLPRRPRRYRYDGRKAHQRLKEWRLGVAHSQRRSIVRLRHSAFSLAMYCTYLCNPGHVGIAQLRVSIKYGSHQSTSASGNSTTQAAP